jgi:hypothetical protein
VRHTRRSPRFALGFAALAPLLVSACPFRHAASAAIPHIDRVRPDSVMVPRGSVVEIALIGHDFAPGKPGANTVQFAGMSIPSVPSSAHGDTIHFVIPDMIVRGGEGPPIALESGPFTVRVTTAAGTSNGVDIRVYR